MSHDLTLSLAELSQKLAAGEYTARGLVDAALNRIATIEDPANPVFLALYADNARARADEIDQQRATGRSLPAFAGIPFAAKDLFDVAGEVTTAGSIVLKTAAPADRHAVVVQKLLDAGLILIGKTNMTEFAFSGLGLNPHYGTPAAWGTSAENACAPGGSSSGAGVSVAAAMVPVSLGTDTAGSCRIPAAWNGVVGYKPTQTSLSGEGAFPLSPLFDAPGPLTRRVTCCHSMYQLMAGQAPSNIKNKKISELRFAVPSNLATSELDPPIEVAFQRTIATLKAAGATIEVVEIPEFEVAGKIFRTAPMATYQAWAIHRERLATHRDDFDPFVAQRVSTGENISDETQATNTAKRASAINSYAERMRAYDALLMPTTANLAPRIEPLLQDLTLFASTNGRALRNTSLSNFVDGCALSIPCQIADEPMIGISVCHAKDQDEQVFAAAKAVEETLYLNALSMR